MLSLRSECGANFGWASRWSPNLEVERYDARNRAGQLHGRFAGERLAQNLNCSRRGTPVDHVDLRKRRVGQLFVVPKNCGRRHEQPDVQPIVAPLAIQQRDELVEPRRPAAARKLKATRRSISKSPSVTMTRSIVPRAIWSGTCTVVS